MMTYIAPDGHAIDSKPYPQVVTYSCFCTDIADGTYISTETTSDDTRIGIQQINIKREVNNNAMTITIVMSSDQELIDYINSSKE